MKKLWSKWVNLPTSVKVLTAIPIFLILGFMGIFYVANRLSAATLSADSSSSGGLSDTVAGLGQDIADGRDRTQELTHGLDASQGLAQELRDETREASLTADEVRGEIGKASTAIASATGSLSSAIELVVDARRKIREAITAIEGDGEKDHGAGGEKPE
jgi:chromosome segregation ATPase